MTTSIWAELPDEWQLFLAGALPDQAGYDLAANLEKLKKTGEVLPPKKHRHAALESCMPSDVVAVIVGQDPYPTPGHAHGLSFSVDPHVSPLPRSLNNIFKELAQDIGQQRTSGYLIDWAKQGVLLLNTVLTVTAHQAGSHQEIGWEVLTRAILEKLAYSPQPIAFILWGRHAQQFEPMVSRKPHLAICSAHPSPLSANRGFFGSRPFSRCNTFLSQNGRPAIDWIGEGL